MKKHAVAAIALTILGVAQMIGDLTGVVPLKAIAAATGASPAPKVFSAVQGLETYSTRFFLDFGDRRVELTPERYSQIRGPYNRRNVYGAALAYAPVLPATLRDPVMRYALCGEAPLLRELGLRSAGVPPADVAASRAATPLAGTRPVPAPPPEAGARDAPASAGEDASAPHSNAPAVVLEPLPGTSLGNLQTRFEVRCQ